MTRQSWIGSIALLALVVVLALALASWKQAGLRAGAAAAANQPEPAEAVATVQAQAREHRPLTTSIGTVVALRSVTLRNELPGTVQRMALVPGTIVEPGTVLVALDTSVEEAELAALKAEAALAGTVAQRQLRLQAGGAVSREALDRAEAEHAVAVAQVARTQAVIARKTIRAPFRARVGIADVHPGQFLEQGTLLTTLQGIDDAIYVDFAVPQHVAAGLRPGDRVDITGPAPLAARIVALDARVDATTRNAVVRARIDDAAAGSPPGASVRVQVAAGPSHAMVALPASALRRDPQGDHVFVIAADDAGQTRATLRRVRTGAVLGDEVLIDQGLAVGEQVAATGSFKLREGALVAVTHATGAAQAAVAAP